MVANDDEAPSSKNRPPNNHNNKWGFCVLGMGIFCVLALLVTWGSIMTKLYIDERLQSCPKLVEESTDVSTTTPIIDPDTSRFLVKITTDPSTSVMEESELTTLFEQASAANQLRIAEGVQEGPAYMGVDQWIDWVVLRSKSELTLLDIFATMPLNDYQTYEVVRLLEAPRN
jgi:hypothetical protein